MAGEELNFPPFVYIKTEVFFQSTSGNPRIPIQARGALWEQQYLGQQRPLHYLQLQPSYHFLCT